MRNLVFYVAVLIFLASCSNNGEQQQIESEIAGYTIKAMVLNDFMEIAIDSLGKEVYIKGLVNHVCSHSGRRCFLVDTADGHSVRVEAKGEINGFNKELEGMDIAVKGIVREKRLGNDYLDDWEVKLKEQKADPEEGGEHCSAELQNINKMRDWMKEHNKDYYSIIYVDGVEYEILYGEEL